MLFLYLQGSKPALAYVLLCMFFAASCAVAIFLPETKSIDLPDYEDNEQFSQLPERAVYYYNNDTEFTGVNEHPAPALPENTQDVQNFHETSKIFQENSQNVNENAKNLQDSSKNYNRSTQNFQENSKNFKENAENFQNNAKNFKGNSIHFQENSKISQENAKSVQENAQERETFNDQTTADHLDVNFGFSTNTPADSSNDCAHGDATYDNNKNDRPMNDLSSAPFDSTCKHDVKNPLGNDDFSDINVDDNKFDKDDDSDSSKTLHEDDSDFDNLKGEV